MANPISSIDPNPLSLTATPSQNAPLLKLSPEILVEILKLLSLPEIRTSSLTCKHLYEVSQDDFVWKILFRSHFPKVIKEIKGDYQQAYRHQHHQRLFNSHLTNGLYTVNFLHGNQDETHSLIIHEDKLYADDPVDHTIKIWDLNSNQCIATLIGHFGAVKSLAIHDGKLYSGSWGGTIKIWDLNSNQCIATLIGHNAEVNSLAIYDGKLYSSSLDGTIQIWDLNSNQCIATLIGHDAVVNSLAIHDGKLYFGSSDSTIQIWDLNSNQCIATLIGHNAEVNSLAIYDGKLYSSSLDGTIQIWDLNSHQCVATLSNQRSDWVLSSLLIHEDKLYSASSSHDGSLSAIKIWDLNSNQCIAILFSDSKSPTGVIYSSLAMHKGKLYSGSRLKIWDFLASHDALFTEIAKQFLDEDPMTQTKALGQFRKMPQTAKNKVYEQLYLLIKDRLTNDYGGCAQQAFYHDYEQFSTAEEKAQAILNYLDACKKSK
jgi:WD40 repeat protein